MQSFPLPIGEINPDGFIEKLKQNTDIFESGVQQDAAEFLGFLLDNIHESLKSEDLASRKVHQQSTSNTSEHNLFAFHTSPSTHPAKATIVQKTFMGELAVRHKCDRCESITTTQEEFITLPVPITHGASVTNCLNKLSKKETLSGSDNKFYCNICRSKQEAQRNSRLASPPKMLLLHFVRFKMVRSYFHKDSSRVTIPFHMRPQHFGMCDELFDKSNPLSQHHVDPRYSLTGIIVHIGGSPKSGHYIAIVQSHGQWFLINDKVLHPIKRTDISLFFGIPNPGPATPETLPSNKAMQALMSEYFIAVQSDGSLSLFSIEEELLIRTLKPPKHQSIQDDNQTGPDLLTILTNCTVCLDWITIPSFLVDVTTILHFSTFYPHPHTLDSNEEKPPTTTPFSALATLTLGGNLTISMDGLLHVCSVDIFQSDSVLSHVGSAQHRIPLGMVCAKDMSSITIQFATETGLYIVVVDCAVIPKNATMLSTLFAHVRFLGWIRRRLKEGFRVLFKRWKKDGQSWKTPFITLGQNTLLFSHSTSPAEHDEGAFLALAKDEMKTLLAYGPTTPSLIHSLTSFTHTMLKRLLHTHLSAVVECQHIVSSVLLPAATLFHATLTHLHDLTNTPLFLDSVQFSDIEEFIDNGNTLITTLRSFLTKFSLLSSAAHTLYTTFMNNLPLADNSDPDPPIEGDGALVDYSLFDTSLSLLTDDPITPFLGPESNPNSLPGQLHTLNTSTLTLFQSHTSFFSDNIQCASPSSHVPQLFASHPRSNTLHANRESVVQQVAGPADAPQPGRRTDTPFRAFRDRSCPLLQPQRPTHHFPERLGGTFQPRQKRQPDSLLVWALARQHSHTDDHLFAIVFDTVFDSLSLHSPSADHFRSRLLLPLGLVGLHNQESTDSSDGKGDDSRVTLFSLPLNNTLPQENEGERLTLQCPTIRSFSKLFAHKDRIHSLSVSRNNYCLTRGWKGAVCTYQSVIVSVPNILS
ncbi:putative Ubiquitin carboxyl-terminal hydrolase 46 [Blattamonas nauphoetae]|uniref:ubiquitinyl hydrolase 1 n=1 Tax=Blattamonas nauphoetae TaxID=2049346 RepID=A0ABQ9YC03_9EUKA|nr:putative Ubiquitin carboxyl-terminal hydrolase 46 [Blattamonas nauphoetae]